MCSSLFVCFYDYRISSFFHIIIYFVSEFLFRRRKIWLVSLFFRFWFIRRSNVNKSRCVAKLTPQKLFGNCNNWWCNKTRSLFSSHEFCTKKKQNSFFILSTANHKQKHQQRLSFHCTFSIEIYEKGIINADMKTKNETAKQKLHIIRWEMLSARNKNVSTDRTN